MVSDSKEALRLLCSDKKEERAEGAAFLGSLGRDGILLAVPLLTDPDWHLRYRACEIIGFTKDAAGTPCLLPRLKDEKDHVRYMAVKSLGLCGAKETRPQIEEMLNDENPFVVRITKQVLEQLQ